MRSTSFMSVPTGDAQMTGDVAEWAMSSLILWLARGGHTATVLVRGTTNGIICFEAGRLVWCESSEGKGEPALYCMLGLTRGSFSVWSGARAPGCNVTTPVDELLLKWALACDETRRALAS